MRSAGYTNAFLGRHHQMARQQPLMVTSQMEILGLANAMFRKLRADLADSNSSRSAGTVAKPFQGINSVVQGVTLRRERYSDCG